MADLTAVAEWTAVPELGTNTKALGGPGGAMNAQAQALINRLELLRGRIGTVEKWSPVGDGVTDDTGKFTALEAERQGTIIDLLGKTYAVAAVPTGNIYTNGYFRVAGSSFWQSFIRGENTCWNGNFDLWRVGTTFSNGTSRDVTADGWTFARSSFATGWTVSQQTGSRGGNLCMEVRRNDGDTSASALTLVFNYSQRQSARLIAAGKAVVSFRARRGSGFSSPGYLLTCQLKHTSAAAQSAITLANGTYSTGDTTAVGSASATLTEQWEDFSFVITIPSTAKQVALRLTYAPVGTAANDFFQIEEVSIEPGIIRGRFAPVPIPVALASAREQIRKSYNDDVIPGTVTNEGAWRDRARGTEASGAINGNIQLDGMLYPGTVTLYSPETGASGKLRNVDDAADISGTAVNIGSNGFVITNSTATISGKLYSAHWVAKAKL